MPIQNSQNIETSNLMWLQAHRCSLKSALVCTLLKFV